MTFDRFQSLPDFHTPFIVNEDTYDSSVLVGEFAHQFQDGLEAKTVPLFSMPGYEMRQAGLIKFQPPMATVDNPMFCNGFPPTPFEHHPLLQPGHVQGSTFQYLPGNDNQSERSLEYGTSPFVESHQEAVDVRTFDASHHRSASAHVPMNPRKRKALGEDESEFPFQKKAILAQVHVQDSAGEYYDISGQTSPFSPYVPTPTGSVGIPVCAPRGTSPRPSGHHYSTSTASVVSLAAPTPHTPAFSPSFTAVKSEHSPGGPMTPIARPSTSSPLKSSVPTLVRTSTMQHSPPEACPTMVAGQTQNFNPYALSSLKANLSLKGDLDSMKDNWTDEEKESRRRLVVFERHQSGSTIHTEFKGVAPQDRQASSICISCIWWKERKEYYVTSVDTIYLLESLVGVRFTVEEKNRIRRNLEGFRPMTVSKAKSDSEEFFKVIMGFPHPKPRNIEKDVKVFPWKILSTALKKIISKYSASYSSTAAPLLTPTSSIYGGESVSEYRYPPSPRTEYLNGPGAPFPVSAEMGYVQQPAPMRMPGPVATAPPELQLHMPEYIPAYDVDGSYAYQHMLPMAAPVTPASMAMPMHPMTAPVTRMPSWEYADFSHEAMINPTQSAPPTTYPRTIETAGFLPTMHYQQQ